MSTDPNCDFDATSCNSLCCPLPYVCWDGPAEEQAKACGPCRQIYSKTGSILCRYPTAYSKIYYKYRINKCVSVSGYSDKKLLQFFPSMKAAKATVTERGGGVGSWPRSQGNRWNHSGTNTKLYPIISECKAPSRCTNPKKPNCKLIPATNASTFIQAGNIFRNTDYKMSRGELISYLTRNRKYLNR